MIYAIDYFSNSAYVLIDYKRFELCFFDNRPTKKKDTIELYINISI